MILTTYHMRFLGFAAILAVLPVFGPSFDEFTMASSVQYIVFYGSYAMLLYAGVFMKGKSNKRLAVYFGCFCVIAHKVFMEYWAFFDGNVYAMVWIYSVSVIPGYLFFTYYNFWQAKLMDLLDILGVNKHLTDKIVGNIKTTNLQLLFSQYWLVMCVLNFFIGFALVLQGLAYRVPPDGSISRTISQFGGFDPTGLVTALTVVFDLAFYAILYRKVILDQKRPDCLGVGSTMTWDGK